MSATEQTANGFVTNFHNMEVGRPISAGKLTVKCPKCGAAAWRKSKGQYVHVMEVTLERSEPKVTVTNACKIKLEDLAKLGIE